jgi:Flp pilus assembly protein protease CpaA
LYFLAFGIGGIAAWLDWKTRTAPNWLWGLGAALALPFLVAEAFQEPMAALIRLGCAGAFAGSLWLLWRGKAFGGADLKGFALFGLILSPVGYYDPWASKFFPALDVLVTSLLLSELTRRLMQRHKMPLFTVAFWPLLLVRYVGGIVWWPLVALLRLFF